MFMKKKGQEKGSRIPYKDVEKYLEWKRKIEDWWGYVMAEERRKRILREYGY